jgi:hypothetical protein
MSRFEPFDVFEVLQDGEVMWYRAAASRAEAQSLAQQKASETKNTFFILNQQTNAKIFVDANGVQAPPPSPKMTRSRRVKLRCKFPAKISRNGRR